MLRFRNPGTQYSTQIQVIKQLYEKLGDQASFSLEDMAVVIAQNKLMTAYGYAGDDALKLSNTDQDSMNSALMNAKMYAEVFRMLGWVTPYGNKSYPLVFTYIGIHVAKSEIDCSALYEQCVLGINNPTELSDRMSYDEKVRFFTCALRSFIDLGGTMYKHELCFGPMSVNDQDEAAYQEMLVTVKQVRGSYKRLKAYFEKFASELGMKPTPVDNCTRLPIAFMKSCNMVESVTDNSLYDKSMQCLKITEHGRDTYIKTSKMKDLRLEEFNSYDESKQRALIRLGVYSMLGRSGYDMSSIERVIKSDSRECSSVLEGKELLFSPYQTIRRGLIEDALDIKLGVGASSHYDISTFESTVSERSALAQIETWDLNISNNVNMALLTEPEDIDFVNQINDLHEKGYDSSKIVETLFDYYITATQTVFYPLIATLFKIVGFKCSFSRPGDNGARWDAIIDDEYRSIPIEIKSPTEEQHLSIKAIRQALENKIVLLSRKTYITSPDVTTLAVGYYMPNERAEVNRLISDIKETYGYKVGVIDLKSLLTVAVSILLKGKSFDKEKLYSLEGLMNASF
jgi:hypothetical protein